ncbi:GntR family transcriptional regulator [Vibrio sp. 10N.286.49.B3]|uniref:GntR family transcriptional regulator n=1 Tax=Vibrio sp. 10N.286.49.B3 TaxID=1880855 RepID=UPI000C8614BF|nr:GntR family transcriptional regulator [Vibrio sp. 10N.286.49.B3]PMH44455.1 GntR family transcriptional regulator [Vibrio sp. 10N.286.49.B3]
MLTDDKIYQKILKSIVEHQLPPGTRLPEDKLSEAFGKSRTTIRKVLQRLALERIVSIEPNKGAHVNNPSIKEAEEVLQSRIMLEPLLVKSISDNWTSANSVHFRNMVEEEKLAAKNQDQAALIQLTAQFHYELAHLSGNSVMAEFIEQLCYRSSLIIAAYGTRHSVSCDCGDHVELINLLDDNNIQQATVWMEKHLVHIKSSLQLGPIKKQTINFQQLFS